MVPGSGHAHVRGETPCGHARGIGPRRGICDGTDRVTMVACNLRFTEGYRAVQANLCRIGRLISIVADFGWYLPSWRPGDDYKAGYGAKRSSGGGIVLDAGIHELDYVLDLAGPTSVVGGIWTASGSLGIEVDDAAEMQLGHVNGAFHRSMSTTCDEGTRERARWWARTAPWCGTWRGERSR